MLEEIWKDIPGFEGMYQISTMGRVKSLARTVSGKKCKDIKVQEKILNQWIDTKGYKRFAMSINGKMIKKLTHRIVAEVFIDNPNNKDQVNHINGIKSDSRIENLEWVNQSENMLHAVRTGLRKPRKSKESTSSKPVVMLDKNTNEKIKEFYCMHDALHYFNKKGSPSSISSCCNGKKLTAHGYKWAFKNI